MPARIIDGAAVAGQVRDEVAMRVSELHKQGVTPGLAVVIVGDNPASQVYVRNKHKRAVEVGFQSFEYRLPEVFAGYPTSIASAPVAFPTASRPQAWAAGTPLLLLTTLLGLHPRCTDVEAELSHDIGHVALRF